MTPDALTQMGHFEPTKAHRLLLVASTGGHLTQLLRLSPSLSPAQDSRWVTFDTAQSRSLLAGREVTHVPYVRPRDVRGVMEARRLISDVLRDGQFDRIVSTGAALAVSAFTAKGARSIDRTYIESVSRVDGPSLTGQIVRRLGLAETFTQHRGWSSTAWPYWGSVLDNYDRPAGRAPVERPKLFVTLGTIEPYRFDALVDAIMQSGMADSRTVWQLGATVRSDLPGVVAQHISQQEMNRFASEADLVITHAGVGTVLNLLEQGIHPLVVPRRAKRGEHVDDHQCQIARLLTDRGIATAREVEHLDGSAITEATRLRTAP